MTDTDTVSYARKFLRGEQLRFAEANELWKRLKGEDQLSFAGCAKNLSASAMARQMTVGQERSSADDRLAALRAVHSVDFSTDSSSSWYEHR
jgi:hypothetical protein